jgi:hypothetical protein
MLDASYTRFARGDATQSLAARLDEGLALILGLRLKMNREGAKAQKKSEEEN